MKASIFEKKRTKSMMKFDLEMLILIGVSIVSLNQSMF